MKFSGQVAQSYLSTHNMVIARPNVKQLKNTTKKEKKKTQQHRETKYNNNK